MIYIEKQKLKETNDIIIEIILNYNSNEGNSKLIEISVLQIENKFFYLEKGKIKDYFISQNNNLFLYMDIGKEDEGYLKVDFLRAKGEIYGKIIKKNQNQIIDINNEVNWESINGKKISNYDFYTKKIYFNKNDTLNCNFGCYLLINIKMKDIGEIQNGATTIFPISIIAI